MSAMLTIAVSKITDVERQNRVLQTILEEGDNERKELRKQILKLQSVFNMPLSPAGTPTRPAKKRRAEVTATKTAASAAPAPVASVEGGNDEVDVDIESNYNNVDAEGVHGGTGLADIIAGAHKSKQLHDGFAFSGLKRPDRFKDNAKFNHCLDLLDAVATDDDKKALCAKDANDTDIFDVATRIARNALDLLNRLEGAVGDGNNQVGYAGVGRRAQILKSKHGIGTLKGADSTLANQTSIDSHFLRKKSPPKKSGED